MTAPRTLDGGGGASVCPVYDRECLPGVETDRLWPRNSLSDIGFGPFLWHAPLMMELNMDTVLAAVNGLHASTGNRVFTLIVQRRSTASGSPRRQACG